MKHLLKLLIPIGLGIAAAFLNQLALQRTAEPVSYVAASGELEVGHVLTEEDLSTVKAPRDLPIPAVLADDLQVLIGMPLQRPLEKGDLILRRDITMAEAPLQLKSDERAITVSLEDLNFEPTLLRVGHPVGFIVEGPPREATVSGEVEAGGIPPGVLAGGAGSNAENLEEIGPFRIVSVGSRTSQFAWDSEEESNFEQNRKEITVAVQLDTSGQLNDDARLLIAANRDEGVYSLMFYPEKTASAEEN